MLSDGNFLFYFNLNDVFLDNLLPSYIFLHIATYLSLYTYSCLLHNHASLHMVISLFTQLHFSLQLYLPYTQPHISIHSYICFQTVTLSSKIHTFIFLFLYTVISLSTQLHCPHSHML